MSTDKDDTISKTLSWLLRHSAEREGLTISPDGFVEVSQLLNHHSLKRVTVADLERVVTNNNKQRFLLKKENGVLLIRANQGHSIKGVDDPGLEPILNFHEVPVVIHGTYKRDLKDIQNSGLKRMGRNHIHFASGLPGASGVKSGVRWDCDVFIYIDLEKALADGIKFYKSHNGVILSPGLNGVIEPKYFSKIQQS